jgi:hypothetical protein
MRGKNLGGKEKRVSRDGKEFEKGGLSWRQKGKSYCYVR